MQIEEILIFCHGDIRYGIGTEHVEQILRVPEVTPLALSPDEVNGLCAVGGNIVTVVDVNRILGLVAVDIGNSESRLLTLTGGHEEVGLLVPQVLDTVDVDERMVERIEDPEDAVTAIYNDGAHIIQLLDIDRLLKDIMIRPYELRAVKEEPVRDEGSNLAKEESARFLLFRMGKERYAVSIDHVREIINVREQVTQIAGSRPEIKGMISLREQLLVISDLRVYYGFHAVENDKSRILVMHYNGSTIGLQIDEIIDIRDYMQSQIDLIPESFRNTLISGVIHDSEQLVSLIGRDVLKRIFKENEKIIVNTQQSDEAHLGSGGAMEVVVFRLGEEEYAIDIDSVSEIIDSTEVTPVADAPAYIDGVINIRGQVVTIGSLHKRLGLAAGQPEEQKIIVCRRGNDRIGFFVNSVSDVMEIQSDEIREEKGRGALFSKVLHLDHGKRLVLLFKPDVLMSRKEAA